MSSLLRTSAREAKRPGHFNPQSPTVAVGSNLVAFRTMNGPGWAMAARIRNGITQVSRTKPAAPGTGRANVTQTNRLTEQPITANGLHQKVLMPWRQSVQVTTTCAVSNNGTKGASWSIDAKTVKLKMQGWPNTNSKWESPAENGRLTGALITMICP